MGSQELSGRRPFLDVPDSGERARVVLVPLPFEGAVSWSRGTAAAPAAIWQASCHVELWDPEVGVDLSEVSMHSSVPVAPAGPEAVEPYLGRVETLAARLHGRGCLVIGVGGDHALTPPLLRGAIAGRRLDPVRLTVVHFDAHADLRDAYDGTPCSHACAIARVLETGARVVSIGVRSAERAEVETMRATPRLRVHWAQDLHADAGALATLRADLAALEGPVYLTFDIDALEVHLCPATGTPEPGGLGWWLALDLLRRVIADNDQVTLVGADVVETAPQPGTRVNEFTAARLIAKLIAYHQSQHGGPRRATERHGEKS